MDCGAGEVGDGVCGGGGGTLALAGGLGMYSGPVWPQPASIKARQAVLNAREDFTIKIRVY